MAKDAWLDANGIKIFASTSAGQQTTNVQLSITTDARTRRKALEGLAERLREIAATVEQHAAKVRC